MHRMSAGPPDAVRFAAGSLEGPRGALWSLWTSPRGDVYVGGHGMTGDIKVSLHASGEWRHAFSREHYRHPAPFAPARRRRVIKKWARPAEFAPGCTRAFQILVPDEHIVTPQDEAIHGVAVHWTPRPGPGHELYFTCVFGSQDSAGWPGRKSMGTRLIHQEDLGSGERLWLLAHAARLTLSRDAALREVADNLLARLADEPEAQLADPIHRVIAIGVEDGTGFYQDLSLPVISGRAPIIEAHHRIVVTPPT
jgi:hypothetical protein